MKNVNQALAAIALVPIMVGCGSAAESAVTIDKAEYDIGAPYPGKNTGWPYGELESIKIDCEVKGNLYTLVIILDGKTYGIEEESVKDGYTEDPTGFHNYFETQLDIKKRARALCPDRAQT